GGFGFDPIFIPNSIPDKTFAEISTAQKNKISHRGQAIIKLTQFLKKKEN
ncbi:MAG: non-canonical purine NTP pyrophosphatase, partial [Promethearchaeota archaeon]